MLKSYSLKLLFFSLFIALGIYYWNAAISNTRIPWHIYLAIVYFFSSTYFFHTLVEKANKQSFRSFVNAFITTTAVRMFAGLVIVLVYALVFKSIAFLFTIAFLVLYFAYLVFDIVSLMKLFKQ